MESLIYNKALFGNVFDFQLLVLKKLEIKLVYHL